MSNPVPWSWPPPMPPAAAAAITTDDVGNTSVVPGATATDALNTLNSNINNGIYAASPYAFRTSPASAYDDEFFGGSPDFSLRTPAWTVWNVTDNVNMVRLGDVNPWGAALANNQYNSTIQGSYMLFQIPRNKRVFVYQAFTPDAAGTVFIRSEVTSGVALNNNFCAARVWINNAGRPNSGAGTTLSAFAMIQNQTNAQIERWGRGDTTDTVISSADNLTSRDGRGFFYSATNQYRFFATGVGGVHQTVPQVAASTGPTIASLAWIGMDFLSADVVNTTNLSSMYVLDYFRQYSGTGWIL